jgi:tungstate transport system ATP-binding protein
MSEPVPVLQGKDLKVTRAGSLLLDVPTLSISAGETLALIGPNGAGKTTLLQCLGRLIKPFTGDLAFRGQRVGGEQPLFAYRRKIAMVFQEPLLFDTTVFANCASGLRIRRLPRATIKKIVMENLERFGISHLKDRSARTLSGGEAQRTSLARAFAIAPEVLFLDEPFAALDPPSREALIQDLEQVLARTRTTTVFATHDRLEALRLSDRIAVMDRGRILQIGPPEEVMNKPADEFVAAFVGVETIIEGSVVNREGGSLIVRLAGSKKTIEAVGEVQTGEQVALCIRPEDVLLSTQLTPEATSARNVFPGRIVRMVPLGLYYRVQLDCGFPLVAYVTNHAHDALALRVDATVKASFKATAIHVVRRKGKTAE